ncbi:MAG: hypothetical protein LM632_06270 [Armatimonadetes bacterium]|nr:hypothetical protein [Armatimonadota bacterium]
MQEHCHTKLLATRYSPLTPQLERLSKVKEMAEKSQKVTCQLCGFQFPVEEARSTVCQSCPLRGGCRLLIKCPNCGYEMPLVKTPDWLGKLMSRIGGWISKQRAK